MICFVNQTYVFFFVLRESWPEIKVSSCSVELMKCVVPTAPLFALALAFTFKSTINYWDHKTSKKRGRPIKMRHILRWKVDSEQQGGGNKSAVKRCHMHVVLLCTLQSLVVVIRLYPWDLLWEYSFGFNPENNHCVLFRLTLADSVFCLLSGFFFIYLFLFCGGVHPQRGKFVDWEEFLLKFVMNFLRLQKPFKHSFKLMVSFQIRGASG